MQRKPWPAAARLIAATFALMVASLGAAQAADPIKIGHVAALSGASAQSGEAITRGLAVAIDEINAKGGLLGGRKLELVQRDDESVPPKGMTAARELIFREKVVAMFGGIDTPVALAMVPVVQQGEGDPHGRVGRRNRHHAQRRDPELRVPRLGGRRAGRRQAARLRQQEVRRQESRADADQQSVGPVERAGPDRRRQRRTPRSRSSASRSSRTPTSTWCRS